MKYYLIFLLTLSSIAFSENQNKNIYENRYLFEISGLLNFETYGKNILTNNCVQFGMNPLRAMNVAVSTSFAYRNYSANLKTILSIDYCYYLDRLEVRAGCLGGVNSMYVGSYSDKAPLCGFEAILGIRLSPNVSVRMQHRSIWHFEYNTVYGSELLAGVTYSFRKIKN